MFKGEIEDIWYMSQPLHCLMIIHTNNKDNSYCLIVSGFVRYQSFQVWKFVDLNSFSDCFVQQDLAKRGLHLTGAQTSCLGLDICHLNNNSSGGQSLEIYHICINDKIGYITDHHIVQNQSLNIGVCKDIRIGKDFQGVLRIDWNFCLDLQSILPPYQIFIHKVVCFQEEMEHPSQNQTARANKLNVFLVKEVPQIPYLSLPTEQNVPDLRSLHLRDSKLFPLKTLKVLRRTGLYSGSYGRSRAHYQS